MYETYSWADPRIHVNRTHHYWKGKTRQGKRTIRLFGDFMNTCLWTPKLRFLGAVQSSELNPNTRSTSNSNMEPYLASHPHRGNTVIGFSSLQMKVIINCNMRFDKFPFDGQVI